MKTISVLIAAFRARRWLGDCLDAVYAQSLPAGWRLQVLVGVDGCDDTLDYIGTVPYPALQGVYLGRNRGTYVTFNTLMQYADGDLIARFDADDVMLADYLRAHIGALEGGADLTMSWSVYTDENLRPTSVVPALPDYRPENGCRRKGTDGQFVAKRHIWERLGGFRAWPCGADTEFVIRAEAAGFRTMVLEDFLYLRRTHASSLTTHPETNYESGTRMRLQELTIQYREEYLAGTRSVTVDSEVETAAIPLRHPAPPGQTAEVAPENRTGW
ncbi:glycosyltransferase family 2 protein [Nitrospirillum iridis]|uniref:Glycosyltransferase involved in cell wall biosynthesis n=1 Tax=Nitrospirillum iridis TaxID=765888 RepID=A0A7X0B1Y1_9PROT|nr:glycosyltransferase family 2 protein [Nitrospirillum iridis]MBB6253180.1 glycosyltransferase involved in cell wall biosynthesis [Nitrospirillum iridis]